jgi:hypothetical protein
MSSSAAAAQSEPGQSRDAARTPLAARRTLRIERAPARPQLVDEPEGLLLRREAVSQGGALLFVDVDDLAELIGWTRHCAHFVGGCSATTTRAMVQRRSGAPLHRRLTGI